MNLIEIIFVVFLFLLYSTLWKIKEINQKKTSGIDPRVMIKSTTPIQHYIKNYVIILSLYTLLITALHIVNFQFFSLFTRIAVLNSLLFDIIGFVAGIFGLSFCLYAQIKMGNSWRVGIDEKNRSELITTGLYKFIRNPTYLGLFIMNFGIWLILPTWTMFLYVLLFYIFLEIQVRCEEEHLIKTHGEEYIEYKKRTKRYLPFIY